MFCSHQSITVDDGRKTKLLAIMDYNTSEEKMTQLTKCLTPTQQK